MTNEDIRVQSDSLMQKLLTEVNGNAHEALFVACGMFVVAKNEITISLRKLTEVLEKQTIKRSRGRPPEFLMINKGMGITQVRIAKSAIRNAKRKRLGAPQKTYLGGMTTRMMAKRIYHHHSENRMQNFQEAARQILNKFEIPYDFKLVKRLAEAARRVSRESH